MTQTLIHKESIWAGPATLVLPVDAKVISVGDQNDMISIWYESEQQSPYENREFEVVGTGMYFNKTRHHNFLGTVIQAEGSLVWHVYEVTQP